LKDECHGNIPMERRNKEPCAEMISGNMESYSFPYFWWSTLWGGFMPKVDLRREG
jgi:hypothetical protein